MKNILALSLAFLSSMAVADMNIDVNLTVGKSTFHKRCVVNPETQLWSVAQGNITLQGEAEPRGDDVLLKLKVFKDDQDHQPVLYSAAVITAEWGKVARVAFENENHQKLLIATVVTR